MNIKLSFLIHILLATISIAFSANENDLFLRREFIKECNLNKNFYENYYPKFKKHHNSKNLNYKIDCNLNFHHYNSSAHLANYNSSYVKKNINEFKIAHWNILKPGNDQSLFKDYGLIASMMDQWDIVVLTELIPLKVDDFSHNQNLLNLTLNHTNTIGEMQALIKKYQNNNRYSDEVKEARGMVEFVSNVHQNVMNINSDIYRLPGYLKILNALNFLDNNIADEAKNEWALILSPQIEGHGGSGELIGIFYRTNKIRPIANKYCDKNKVNPKGINYACMIPMDESVFENNKNQVDKFLRRPFMGSFNSGKYDFTLVGSHLIFGDKKRVDQDEFLNDILRKKDLNKIEEIKSSLNVDEFLRFGEAYLTLSSLNYFNEKYYKNFGSFIWTGDWNLEYEEEFWPYLLTDNEKLFIKGPTSLTQNTNNSLGGLSRNYDHFIVKDSLNNRCFKPQINNFLHTKPSIQDSYPLDELYYRKDLIAKFMKKYWINNINFNETNLQIQNLVENREQDFTISEEYLYFINNYQSKLFNQYNLEYFKLFDIQPSKLSQYKESYKDLFSTQFNAHRNLNVYFRTISDHLPISLTCSNN